MTTAPLAVALVVAVVVQAVTGSGFGVIAAPAMVALAPGSVPGALLVLTVVVMLGEVWRGRRAVRLHDLAWPLVGYVGGAPVALMILPHLDARATSLAVAVTLLVAVVSAALGWRPRATPLTLVIAGVASALAGVLAGLPGPPVVIVYREADAARLRATLAAYFAVTAVLSTVLLAVGAHLSANDVWTAARWVPAVGAGAALAGIVMRRVRDAWMRPLTLGVSLLGGLLLLARAAL